MSENNNTASAPANADRTTCPTCGRPISAPSGQGTGPRSGPPATGPSAAQGAGGSLASAAQAPSGIGSLRPNSEAIMGGPGMLMAGNLRDSHYVRTIYGSLSHLGERFTRVSPEGLAEAKLVLTRKGEFTSGRKACGQQ